MIFNRYLEKGGEEAAVASMARILGRHHEVVSCYFNSADWGRWSGPLRSLRQAAAMVYNPAAVRQVQREIDAHRPEVILMHNIFPVGSAALLLKLVHGPVPIVHYVHNFRPYSVSGYCWTGDQLCDAGIRKNFWPEIWAGSWQGSRLRTAWYALIILGLHQTGAYRRIGRWVAISSFMKQKFVEAGVEPERVTVLRHAWERLNDGILPHEEEPSGHPPYLLFLGRLTEAKGLKVLMEAWQRTTGVAENARLVIGGDGPLAEWVRQQAHNDPRIDYRGHVDGQEKARLLRGARAVVVPSIWWEPLGVVVYEAYDYSKPALVAASGGLTETVVHGQTGLLHEPGNSAKLAEHMERVLGDPELAFRLGAEGRVHLLKTTDTDAWLQSIETIFTQVVAASGKAGVASPSH